MSDAFSGRVVVLTGARTPLGEELRGRFGSSGAMVVACDTAGGPGAERLATGDEVAHRELVSRVLREQGRLDVWVNHHPLTGACPAVDLTLSEWQEALAGSVTAALVGAQAAATAMLPRREGVIVNVGTVDGFHPPTGRLAVSVGQAALVTLTEALGVEWAPHGVRVVGVAADALDAPDGLQARQPGDTRRQPRIPLGRPATVAELAEAVLFVAGPEASYVCGETLRVDGGWSAYQLF